MNDCPYLKPEAHDGAWDMLCAVGDECNTNWEEHENCNRFKNMKKIKNRKYIGLDAEGEFYPVDEEKRSIVLNGTEYILPKEVWEFMFCLVSERDYFREKVLGVTPFWYKTMQ